ncbi:MAG: TonB-dependent receptor [Polyangiaceae bacterium]|nr:TonB-dependent receptor [Polyangiaceae bacterium]
MRNAATQAPIPDVVITVTSPALQGEQIVVTDAGGNFRVPQIPPGEGYAVSADGGQEFKPSSRGGIKLTSGSTVRVNILLLPLTGVISEVVEARAPVVDVGSSRIATTIDQELTRRLAVNAPSGKGGASRSFESLAQIAPGANADQYGTSVNGTTSPENAFIIDGVSANDPAFGVNAVPLSAEFVKEVNIITAGYLPEYGRSIGGVMDVVTKSGSNEFHGSVFGSITPGAFEGQRTQIAREGGVIQTNPSLGAIRDFGFEIGGPILKDKLWFFAGFQVALQRYNLDRTLNSLNATIEDRFMPDPDFAGKWVPGTDDILDTAVPVIDPETGFQRTTALPGTSQRYYADQQVTQYIGKLTWNINQDHNVTLTVFGAPSTSGGNGTYGIDSQDGGIAVGNLVGPYSALGGTLNAFNNSVVLKSSSAFMNKKFLIDATLGWVYNTLETGAADGTNVDDIGNPATLAGQPGMSWRRNSTVRDPATGILRGRQSITQFENLPDAARAQCDPTGDGRFVNAICPVTSYRTGGAGFMNIGTNNRYQGRVIATGILKALGEHTIKAGVDFEVLTYTNRKGYGGGVLYRESVAGTTIADFRHYGFLEGPDQVVDINVFESTSTSTTVGGFVQDSWNILDRVTVNLGVRYDAQVVTGNDGNVGLSLPNQWSPRIGAIWDPTREGRAKITANFARFYQAVTLNLVDRSFPGELNTIAVRPTATCDPLNPGPECRDISNYLGLGGPYDANQKHVLIGGDRVPVDPDIKPQSSDQFVIGGEYEIITDSRVGAAYTKQWLNYAVEDMSRDEATTYFIGNPGYGIAKDFPKATRDYDSFMVYFQKSFSKQWLAQVNYTLSWNRGNIAGLFRPETGQLDPNINSDFDLISLLDNRTGDLPGDRRHVIKVFGAKEFTLPHNVTINLGLGYTGLSGTPQNVLGSHPIYGAAEVFILPRGTFDRNPWRHSIDTNITLGYQFSKTNAVTLGVDIFNLFNFQQATGFDQNYTAADVLPCKDCSKDNIPNKDGQIVSADPQNQKVLRYTDGSPFDPADINPNWQNPTSYQTPRQIRINARVTF